jgi:hypothetical protein
MVGDVPLQVVVLDVFAGVYDPLTLDNTPMSPALSLPVQALVSNYRAPELAPDTVLSTDRKVVIRQAELPGIHPAARDRVTMAGALWYVLAVHQDTGGSVWVLQCRRDSEAQ